MRGAFERLEGGILIVVALLYLAMLLVDRAQLKSRVTGLTGGAGGIPRVWMAPASVTPYWFFWGLCLALRWIRFVAERPATRAPAISPLWQKLFLTGMIALVACLFHSGVRYRRRWRAMEAFRLSRGVLMDAIAKMARGTMPTLLGPLVYVLPDLSLVPDCARLSARILVPRPLLDLLSRREIDALVARQVCVQSKQFWFRPFWMLLACDILAVSLVQSLRAGTAICFVAYLLLLAAELAALSVYLPHALLEADLRAIRLTGDAEAFFSAQGGLSRFNGAPLPEATLREIARRTGVPPERMAELLASHPSPPEEDRYPTSGPYMVTGLQTA